MRRDRIVGLVSDSLATRRAAVVCESVQRVVVAVAVSLFRRVTWRRRFATCERCGTIYVRRIRVERRLSGRYESEQAQWCTGCGAVLPEDREPEGAA